MTQKITKFQAQTIINDYVSGKSSKDLSKEYNLRKNYICKLIQGYTWKACNRPSNIKEISNLRSVQAQIKKGYKDEYHKSFPPLTKIQNSIITGSLLGDGYVHCSRECYQFEKQQCAKYKQYLDWHLQELRPYSNKIRERFRHEKLLNNNGKIVKIKTDKEINHSFIFSTHSHPIFAELRKKWYPHNKKTIPTDIELTEEAIAVWYGDDGCNDLAGRRAYLCTNGFLIEEVDFLREKLKSFSIYPNLTKVKSKYTGKMQPVLSFGGENYDCLINLIKPHLFFHCFSHKIAWRKAILASERKNRLTNDEVFEILQLRKIKSAKEISELKNISLNVIYRIVSGRSYR